MIKKINFLYDSIPFITNSYLSNNIYNKNDNIDNNILDIDENIFIINFVKPSDTNDKSSLKYNDPNYILFNKLKDNYVYNLPSINYYNDFSFIKVDKKWETDTFINKLLNDLGYNNYLTAKDIFDEETDETLFYQMLKITDINKNEKINCIFIFFYTENEVIPNNLSESLYNNKIWGNKIYPYKNSDEIVVFNNNGNNNVGYLNKNENKIEINFDNVEYINFLDKILYNYYLEINISDLNNTRVFGKSLISNSEFVKLNNVETVIINLNEICIKQNDNINIGLFDKLNIFRTNKFNISSNTANYFSLTSDDKLNYNNMKIFNNSEKYTVYYNYLKNKKIAEQYYINNTIPIQEVNFNLVNKNIRKILITITNEIIKPDFIYELEIYNILQNNNELIFDVNNNLNLVNGVINTNTYYSNLYRIVFKYDSKIYYIIINLVFYNCDNLYIYENKTFVNNCYLIENFCLEPTFYNLTNEYNIYQNINNLTTENSKYYYYFVDYDKISNDKSDYNRRMINHFYMNVSNINIELKYDETVISNIINILPLLINNIIYDIVLINTYYVELKNNIYNLPSTLILSLILDNNIDTIYIDEEIIGNDRYKKINLTDNVDKTKNKILDLLNLGNEYLTSSFSLLIKIYDDYRINSFESDILIKIINEDTTEEIIKIFNYKNGEGELYEGYIIVPRIMIINYYNFYTINIFFDAFNRLGEKNVMLFDKDNFLLKLHTEIYSKNLIEYDAERLKTNIIPILDGININEKYEEYYNIYKTDLESNYTIFILNCENIIVGINDIKILIEELLDIDRSYINDRHDIIDMINGLIINCINLSENNRELYLTYSETITNINDLLVSIENINIDTSNEKLVNLKSSCVYIIKYFYCRIKIVEELYELNNELVSNINIYNNYYTNYNEILNNINLSLMIDDENIKRVNRSVKMLFFKDFTDKILEQMILTYNENVPLNIYNFSKDNIENLKNELNKNVECVELFKMIINFLKLCNYKQKKCDELNEIINNNVVIEQDFNEINSYEVYIDRISQLKNMSINNFNNNYNENINLVNIVNNKQVNEDINSLYTESNIIANENELLMLNYNYLNTEYVFIDKN